VSPAIVLRTKLTAGFAISLGQELGGTLEDGGGQ
jgi:hypothetical protein